MGSRLRTTDLDLPGSLINASSGIAVNRLKSRRSVSNRFNPSKASGVIEKSRFPEMSSSTRFCNPVNCNGSRDVKMLPLNDRDVRLVRPTNA